jgi:prepilin signal peptidase PulO-like enzyme (type II secretory pathway)
MSSDPFDIRRIELDADTSVWIPDRRLADTMEPDPPSPARPVVRVRPTAVVAATAAAGVALLRLGPTHEGLLAAWVLAVLVLLAAIDFEVRLLPNRIVYPAILCAIAWQAAFFPDRLAECLVAGVAAGAVLLLPSLIQPGAVGMGDVKVTAFLGVVLGSHVVVALLAGSLLSAPIALAILLVGGAGAKRTALPFGPFLTVGAAIALLG